MLSISQSAKKQITKEMLISFYLNKETHQSDKYGTYLDKMFIVTTIRL